MLPSLQTLLASANAITSNSEPLSWDIKHTKVFFENQNNGERFYLYLDQEANNYSSEGYRFHLLDSDLSIVNWGKELKVDSNKYDEYIDKYIKISGSDELPFWDIVLNHIKSVDK